MGLRITLKIAKTMRAVRAGADSERPERRAGGKSGEGRSYEWRHSRIRKCLEASNVEEGE